jgi:ethanolamine utilization protein EutA (predicted chaperonin)
MTNEVTPDLNEIIATAVQARITASVAAALSEADTFKAYVVAALQQPVEVPESPGSYRKKQVPYMNHLISQAIKQATQVAVKEWINNHLDDLKDLVTERLEHQAPRIADAMVGRMATKANDAYGVNVELRFPG